MRLRAACAVGLAVVGVGFAAGEACGQAAVQAAVARSKQTGLPMLVIGVTDACPHCIKLRQRLQTEPELVELLKQYVPIGIKAGSRNSRPSPRR